MGNLTSGFIGHLFSAGCYVIGNFASSKGRVLIANEDFKVKNNPISRFLETIKGS
jgi:hypothetical protein